MYINGILGAKNNFFFMLSIFRYIYKFAILLCCGQGRLTARDLANRQTTRTFSQHDS